MLITLSASGRLPSHTDLIGPDARRHRDVGKPMARTLAGAANATGRLVRAFGSPGELLMRIVQLLKSFVRDEEGVTAIEYGLIAALIAVVIIGAVELVGGGVSATFNTIAGELSSTGGTK